MILRRIFTSFAPPSLYGRCVSVLIAFCMLSAAPAATLAQRAITNPSIEDPAFEDGIYYFYSEELVPGWLTSHPVQPAGCTNGTAGPGVDCRPIERWSTTFLGVTAAPGAGSRWVELNPNTLPAHVFRVQRRA